MTFFVILLLPIAAVVLLILMVRGICDSIHESKHQREVDRLIELNKERWRKEAELKAKWKREYEIRDAGILKMLTDMRTVK